MTNRQTTNQPEDRVLVYDSTGLLGSVYRNYAERAVAKGEAGWHDEHNLVLNQELADRVDREGVRRASERRANRGRRS